MAIEKVIILDKSTIKYREMYNAALQWLVLKCSDVSIADYLVKKGIYTVAIYGMSDLGNCLYRELEKSNFRILYTIDQGFPKLYYDVDCYKLPEIEDKEKPDLIIVTLPHLYDRIVADVRKYCDCDVMSITELVYDVMYDDLY